MEQARYNMICQQIRPWNVIDPVALESLATVRREAFVPAARRALAFADLCLPLGEGKSEHMLEPKMEAYFIQALALEPTDKVLEIGTGSGYMAALLAHRADFVVSLEINPVLAQTAQQNLAAAGVRNVHVETADGSRGCAERGPFDVIVISGGIPAVPDRILAQLAPGGRLLAVAGETQAMLAQVVTCEKPDTYRVTPLFETNLPWLRNFAGTGFVF